MRKLLAIEFLEIAEANLLNSLVKLRPEDVYKQAHPQFNTIAWIVGHCAVHFHMVLSKTCQGKSIFSDEIGHYFRYGTTKKEISESELPITFSELIDEYLQISSEGFLYLHTLGDADFEKVIFPEINETLMHSIQRIALHYMGHMGQIVLLRRALANPGPTFVGGVKESSRKKMREEWISWWNNVRDDFKI